MSTELECRQWRNRERCLRHRVKAINTKRHQLIAERKHRAYTTLLGHKMARLGEERTRLYAEMDELRDKINNFNKQKYEQKSIQVDGKHERISWLKGGEDNGNETEHSLDEV